jgi:aryl carrier-like protein
LGRQLVGQLRERGQEAVLVWSGEQPVEPAEGEHRLGPGNPGDVRGVLETLRSADGMTFEGVVDLRALDARLVEDQPLDGPMSTEGWLCGGLLHLVQAILAECSGQPPGLWIVTRGGQPVDLGPRPGDSDAAGVVQAPLWGMSHVVALEHPELRCVRIDLDPTVGQAEADEREVRMLAVELLGRDGREDQIAYRSGSRSVRRLVRSVTLGHPERDEPLRFRGDASYLITGGLDGLGLLVAEWMVEHGARQLMLAGRSAPAEAGRQAIDRMERAGARVIVAQADVADRARLASLMAQIEVDLPPLRGIIHSAGVLDDGVLLQQSWERFAAVMRPKVLGAWHLHELTRALALDYFVLFSSGASVLGSAGQANHAAANAFLDALAAYRRSLGLPGLSINWGAWAEVGAAARRQLDAAHGVDTLSPEHGLQALERLLRPSLEADGAAPAQVAVLPVRWSQFVDHLATHDVPPLLGEIVPQERPGAVGPSADGHRLPATLTERLATCLPNKRRSVLAAFVREQAAMVLGRDPRQPIDVDRPLQELGLDSLMAVELRNRLGSGVGQALPATLLFEHPTLRSLADYLAGPVLHLAAPSANMTDAQLAADGPTADGDVLALDRLTEAEIATLLSAKLDAVERKS